MNIQMEYSNSTYDCSFISGHEYKFRVSAVNKMGYSDLLETKEKIVVGS